MIYHLLLHHQLLKSLRRQPPAWRAELQRTLENLQLGYWGGGTRVKLLQGARKLVYEARVTLSLRLLFTVARGYGTQPPYEQAPFILVWDVVDHDHLNRAARLNLQPEAGFLDFAERASIELSGDAPPPTPERATGTAPRDPAEFADWLQRDVPPPTGDELTESIRWFALDPDMILEPAQWQALFDDPTREDLELKLSREQAETVFTGGPVLLKGTAGSGKTTVTVYRLARAVHEQPQARVLYVTYSGALLATVRQLYEDLLHARRQMVPAPGPAFLTFPQLYRQLLGHRDELAPLVRYPYFAQWYASLYGRDDAALAWEEIRGIIKGACLDAQREELSLAEYVELGRKRAPLFVDERPRLYKVYQKYRDWLRQSNRHDDLDLARQAAKVLRQGSAATALTRYDQIICDEGQDLTELELQLLLDLCQDLHGLFFAADPQQIVNPSGFRWAELRSRLRVRASWAGQVEPRRLSRNYRSVDSIVGLANALLTLQRERTGRGDDDDLQETTLHGAAPVLVHGDEAEALGYLRGFGPRCAVIAASEAEAARLGQLLATERVFDVAGAKGLEFDGCVLWNPFSADLPLWERLLAGDASLKEDPVVRRALRHVYVGVTRARRYLGVYERDARALALWRSGALRAHLEQDAPAALAKFMLAAASPAEWAKEGEYFLTRERYRQAAECFRRAGREREAGLATAAYHESLEQYGEAVLLYRQWGAHGALARCLERGGHPLDAAPLYRDAGDHAGAARCYEAAHAWHDAALAYQQLNDEPRRRHCQLRHCVSQRDWLGAARIAVKQEDLAAAADYYEKAGEKKQALELRIKLAEQSGDHGTLARHYEASHQYADAALAFQQAGQPVDAARCRALAATAAHDFATAASAWEDAGDPRRAAQARIKQAEAAGDWLGAARLHAARDDAANLRRCLHQAQGPEAETWRAALAALDRGDALTAAELYEKFGDDEQAMAMIKRYDKQDRSHEDPLKANERIDRLAHLLDHIEIRSAIARADWRFGLTYHAAGDLADDHETSRLRATCAEQLSKWGDAGRYYETAGDYPKALACFQRTRRQKDTMRLQARCHEAAGEWAAAVHAYEAVGMPQLADRCRAHLPVDAASVPAGDGISVPGTTRRRRTSTTTGRTPTARQSKRAPKTWQDAGPEAAGDKKQKASKKPAAAADGSPAGVSLSMSEAVSGTPEWIIQAGRLVLLKDGARLRQHLEQVGTPAAQTWGEAYRLSEQGDMLAAAAQMELAGDYKLAHVLATAYRAAHPLSGLVDLEPERVMGRLTDHMRAGNIKLRAEMRYHAAAGMPGAGELELATNNDDQATSRLRADYSAQEGRWALAAKFFEQAGAYDLSLHAAEQTKKPKLIQRASAWVAEAKGEWATAGELFTALTMKTPAARCAARAAEAQGQYGEAAQRWRRLRQPAEARRCEQLAAAADQAGSQADLLTSPPPPLPQEPPA